MTASPRDETQTHGSQTEGAHDMTAQTDRSANPNTRPIKNVVIVGGGTAGWMAAAGLSRMIGADRVAITLVESEAIGTVGVGEATLPHLRHFNDTLGIDEAQFLRETRATIKLGIDFVDWGRLGEGYIHPFGDHGLGHNGVKFHHYWTRMAGEANTGPIEAYSLPVVAARLGRFAPPADDPRSVLSTYRYAYQLDAIGYAAFLRRFAEQAGVARVEGRVTGVERDGQTGDVSRLVLSDGRTLDGDLFVDCSGFRSLILGDALGVEFEDWSHWLACDRAVAVACDHAGPVVPFTRATAKTAGWQWRIPLQHRTGNGHVYASAFMDEDTATQALMNGLEGPPLAEPRHLRFTAGRRAVQWSHNCVAVGLSGGFLEPLESTSIYLIQQAITRLIEAFPKTTDHPATRTSFNRLMNVELERIRDFLVLHYHVTQRDDSQFWNTMRTMSVPDSLAERMALFAECGHVTETGIGLFLEPSWVAVMLGQGLRPARYDGRADQLDDADVRQHLANLRGLMQRAAQGMPAHADWLSQRMGTSPAQPPRVS